MKQSVKVITGVLWATCLLLPASRAGLELIGIILWPSIQPFKFLGTIHPTYAPLTLVYLVGISITYVLGTRLYSNRLKELFYEDPEVKNAIVVPVISTISWVVFTIIDGRLIYPDILVSLTIVWALVDRDTLWKPKPLPEPQPQPVPVPGPTDNDSFEDSEDDLWYYRRFNWKYNEEPFRKRGKIANQHLSIKISREEYQKCLDADHHPKTNDDYVKYANANLDHPTVKDLSSKLKHIVEENHYDEFGELHLMMSFTLSMNYAYDDIDYGGEYPKFPIEMLKDKKGDCEDFSILCSCLFYTSGYKSALVLMDFTDQMSGHAAVGVVPPLPLPIEGFTVVGKDGIEYVYCEVTSSETLTTKETTDMQWVMGEMHWKTAINLAAYPLG